MAFGFPAYHEEIVTGPAAVTHDHVVHACQVNGFGPVAWVNDAIGGAWRVWTGTTFWSSWGEEVVLRPLAANVVRLRSQCVHPLQCVDFGKNAANVKKIAAALLTAMAQPEAPPYR
jgi:hypothetical protein